METWKWNTYFQHHGIKGQKWGDRNYQYEDGSLTPEGKRRYGVGEAKTGNAENAKKVTSSMRQDNIPNLAALRKSGSLGRSNYGSNSQSTEKTGYNVYGTGGVSQEDMTAWGNALKNNPNWASLVESADFSSMSNDDFKNLVNESGMDASKFTDKQLTAMKIHAQYLQNKANGEEGESSSGTKGSGGSGKKSSGGKASSKKEEKEEENKASNDEIISNWTEKLLDNLDNLDNLDMDLEDISLDELKEIASQIGFDIDELSDEQLNMLLERTQNFRTAATKGKEAMKSIDASKITLADIKTISEKMNNGQSEFDDERLKGIYASVKKGSEAVHTLLKEKFSNIVKEVGNGNKQTV